MTSHTAFGPWLERYMANQNPPITRPELSRRLNIDPATLSRWITGKSRPSADTLVHLADILDVEVGELYTLAGYGRPAAVGAAVAELPRLDPLAAELDRMLSSSSPLPADTRDMLREIINRIVAPHRREMRKRRTA